MARGAHVLGVTLACFLLGPVLAAEPVQRGPGAQAATGLVLRGDDRFIAGEAPVREPIPGPPVSLNLVEVPLAVAARAVLADTFGWGYALDERAAGTITLQTGGAVPRETLLALFETALSSRGLALRRRGRTAQIVPAAGGLGIQPVQGRGAEAGAVAVPLRWISAAEMQAILAAVAPREVVLRADRARNLLILNGDAGQIQALRQTIAVFDVDWMRGMSTAMLPVRSANPATLARDLTQIFGGEASGTGDVIRFIPNEPLNAILVVSSRAAYLDRARVWLEQLEGLAAERERQLFVYRIQNRSAKELAAVLQGWSRPRPAAASTSRRATAASAVRAATAARPTAMAARWVARHTGRPAPGRCRAARPRPRAASVAIPRIPARPLPARGRPAAWPRTGAAPGSAARRAACRVICRGASPAGCRAASPVRCRAVPGAACRAGAPAATGPATARIRASRRGYGYGARRDVIGIVADEANNSLVISATRNQYDKILRILGRLDAMPTQVLLETVIAEVTLTNELQFGVQWFLKNRGDRLNLAQGGTVGALGEKSGTAALIEAAARGVTGFNYLMNAADFNVVLNALQGMTRVNVISSPNITVLDNRTAKLQIGDQVPIVKQSGQSALAGNAPILNQIELKDTGVILSVTPRVNKNGLVVLDINQEVSDVVRTTTSAINSPTIRQRRVATSVAVSDGHSLAIGGMVQEKAQITNEAVPLLGDLPLVGPAFRNRIDTRVRTELIVFIRPRVIRGTAEADRIAEDFRQQFRAMMPVRPVPPPPPLAAHPEGTMGILRRMVD
ncbi:type II secretion system secretin GspD [Methylobacterium gregans]|uniref:type II secretion system secretin GspD n=1 Tax=Methylobacterium gregans TaxID=374424 RepID=UPI0036182AB1